MNRADLKNLVYMQIAKTLSQLSTCNRLKVGAVLLGYDGSVVGTGYNGSLPGLTHCDEASCNASQRCLAAPPDSYEAERRFKAMTSKWPKHWRKQGG